MRTTPAFTWGKRLTSCRERITNVVPLTSIKIVLVAWQIVTQFSSVLNVVYPGVYERFLSVLNVVNFNLGFILSVSCIVDSNFYGCRFFATICPLVVFGAQAVTYTVSKSRNRHSPAGMQAAKSKHLSITLFIMFVVYSSVPFNIFQTFVCERLDTGMDYLRADYSLTCYTGVHKAMMVYAGLMIFVYPVGIPAFYAWWLLFIRHYLVKVGAPNNFLERVPELDHLQPMRDLWAPYKPHRYYFEVVECGHRIALTGLAAFLLPNSAAQAAIEVVLAAIFVAVSDVLSPFVDPFDAWLYRIGGWITCFSMYLALVDVSDEDNQSQAVFAKVLIAAHAGMVAVIVVQAVL
ncbi:probable extracellular nuclease (ISS) [Ectocarpus siliculosus]|uniref:Probable extracellular nuclease (ISS) n=1 Tax=Ectocarpus siliculosus TaxID=2880 RepID=D7G8S0_ECTSI|nr:probable extracellular nuclease (ISS) [Ectocarpus siliculosus]|eukprot:CBJ28094.1 probable extracellular nuclease (ISS) [Ectocarpus siliculosus]